MMVHTSERYILDQLVLGETLGTNQVLEVELCLTVNPRLPHSRRV